MSGIAKPFIPWIGSKEKLIPYIWQVFPPNPKLYLEPFGGGGALLLGMQPKVSRMDIYNDFNCDLVNLFLCARECTVQLVRELKFIPFHSRAEFDLLKEFMKHKELLQQRIADERNAVMECFSGEEREELLQILCERSSLFDVQRAAAYYKVCRGSFSGTTTSFGVKPNNLTNFLYLFDDASKRLQDVIIENKDCLDIIRERDGSDSLIYCDPPYFDAESLYAVDFPKEKHAEHFAAEKSAIFLVLPEEDNTKNFMAGLMIQNLSRELFSVADEHGGKLQNRVVFYCDELGTMPPFDILPLFSAGRSRKLTLVPIIQSLAQLEKNYGKEGAEIIADNCQDTIFGGFAPNSQTAETLSKALGSRTVLTGSVSKGKDNTSQSLQMAERALLSPDELKNLPKGNFIVMKTGTHPMRTKLQLYFKWGIKFEEPYQVPERAQREVYYAGKEELLMNIKKSLYSQPQPVTASKPDGYMRSYGDK